MSLQAAQYSQTQTLSDLSSETEDNSIIKEGCLVKRKSKKKRYFVLRKGSLTQLEYYASKKDGLRPKKTYNLSDVFIINKRILEDTYIVILFLNGFSLELSASNTFELQDWLEILQKEKKKVKDHSFIDDDVWCVKILKRGLGDKYELAGYCFACLSSTSLSLVHLCTEEILKTFALHNIRQYGLVDQYFKLELGKNSGIGSGSLYMTAGDKLTTENMHDSIVKAIINGNEDSHVRVEQELSVSNFWEKSKKEFDFFLQRSCVGIPFPDMNSPRSNYSASCFGSPSSQHDYVRRSQTVSSGITEFSTLSLEDNAERNHADCDMYVPVLSQSDQERCTDNCLTSDCTAHLSLRSSDQINHTCSKEMSTFSPLFLFPPSTHLGNPSHSSSSVKNDDYVSMKPVRRSAIVGTSKNNTNTSNPYLMMRAALAPVRTSAGTISAPIQTSNANLY